MLFLGAIYRFWGAGWRMSALLLHPHLREVQLALLPRRAAPERLLEVALQP